MVEQELLGVDQRPDDVLVGGPDVLAVLGEVGRRDLQFVVVGLAGIDPAIEFANLGFRGPLVGGQQGGPARGAGNLVLDLAAV